MSHYKTFRIIKQNKDAKPSFLIIVIDGIGSIRDEYDLMIDDYKTVFYDKIQYNEVHAIQFGSNNQISYLISGGGNFNLAFENVLEKLEEDIEADITICVVSYSRGPCNIKGLNQKQLLPKKNIKYNLQAQQLVQLTHLSYYKYFEIVFTMEQQEKVSSKHLKQLDPCRLNKRQQSQINQFVIPLVENFHILLQKIRLQHLQKKKLPLRQVQKQKKRERLQIQQNLFRHLVRNLQRLSLMKYFNMLQNRLKK